MISEKESLAADDREANSVCPMCGGNPTRFRYSPNKCQDCYIPVVHWQTLRQLTDEIERLRAEVEKLKAERLPDTSAAWRSRL